MSSRPEPVLIGDAARMTGVSAKMIRHYESLGLLPPPPRSDGGYRRYDAGALESLRFIRRSRDLGFTTEDIRHLLGLWRNPGRASAKVKHLAQQHLNTLEQRIQDMQDMRNTLRMLTGGCPGDEQPDCPILDTLSAPPAPTTARARRPTPICRTP
ncbi:MAG: Cu(I)-responsive transcriptional regulator [Aquabacterium sp.]